MNTVGVATHFTWGPSPYRRQYAQAKAALGELGIRHIRDSVGNRSATTVYRDLHNSLGLKLVAVVDTRRGSGAGTRLDPSQIQGTLDRAKSQIGMSMLTGFEGPNEYNQMERNFGYRGWPQELRDYQRQLYTRVKADPVLRSLPVVGPSMADPMQDGYYERLGDLSGSLDRGNAHVYPNWLSWDQKMRDVLPFARILAPREPIWATETGWHMAYNSGAQWVREDVLVKYLPRAMASFVASPDLERAYLYQLIDSHADPRQTTTTSNFGLIDYNMRRKETFYAVRNMMHVMCDDPLPFAPQSLRYSLSGNLSDIRTLLFQKRNRSFYLVMWQEKQSFRRGQPLINAPQAVNVRFEEPISQVRAYQPSDRSSGIARSNLPKRTYARPGAVSLNISDAITVLEIIPTGNAVPPVSTRCDFNAT